MFDSGEKIHLAALSWSIWLEAKKIYQGMGSQCIGGEGKELQN